MIYLSAQPDDSYFVWQLEIQLTNFKKLGIKKEFIHVLVGFSKSNGLNYLFKDFINRYKDVATFFCYPDNRRNKRYAPSIRPHIINQHYRKYLYLQESTIFYHDCDIVFTTGLPDFKRLSQGDTWYFSDARNYLDSKFIILHGQPVFKDMCKVVGINEDIVKLNDPNAGGAQALIKNVDYNFWAMLEDDCTKLFIHLTNSEARYAKEFSSITKKPTSEYKPISAWCADMWALLWNAIKRNTPIKIDRELDFCWPHESVDKWTTNKIFHNAGVDDRTKDTYFYKALFLRICPYDYDFSYVSSTTCSYKYVLLLNKVARLKKYQLLDTTFYFIADTTSIASLNRLYAAIAYISKYFETNILILEFGSFSQIKASYISKEVKHILHSSKTKSPILKEQIAINNCATDIIFKYDINTIISPSQLNMAILSVRHGKFDFCYAHSGRVVQLGEDTFNQCIEKKKVKKLLKQPYMNNQNYIYNQSLRCIATKKKAALEIGYGDLRIRNKKYKDQELYILYKSSEFKVGMQEGFVFTNNCSKPTPTSKSEFLKFTEAIS